MASPVVASIVTNKASYAKGETITATMTWSDSDRTDVTITGTVTDSSGNVGTGIATIIIDPADPQMSSVPSRPWVRTSNNGTVATFTATA
jgi:hypothetical protein